MKSAMRKKMEVVLKQQEKIVAVFGRIIIFYTYTYKNLNPIHLLGKRTRTANLASNKVKIGRGRQKKTADQRMVGCLTRARI
ncbi:MAG: hypothetical protein ACI8PD_001971 [Nitrospinales bacterium]|jgi:hypothetical protein